MKRFLAALIAPCTLLAADGPVDFSEAMRKGLFAEEATRDLDAAAREYQSIIDSYATQRQHAGTALFRLAEIRRKQGKKDEAAKLYQRVVAEFSNDETLARLSRENLLGMGQSLEAAKPGSASAPDEEEQEIARIKRLAKESPDLLTSGDGKELPPLLKAAEKGWIKVVEFALSNGMKVNQGAFEGGETALHVAARAGRLAMVEYLLSKGADINARTYPFQGFGMGDERNRTPLVDAFSSSRLEVARFLLSKGASPDQIVQIPAPSGPAGGTFSRRSMLAEAVVMLKPAWVDLLLEYKADPNKIVNFTTAVEGAVKLRSGGVDMLKKLFAAGAKADQQGDHGAGVLSLAGEDSTDARKEKIALLIEHGALARCGDRFDSSLRSLANPSSDTQRYYPLYWPLRAGDKELCSMLFKAGADVNEHGPNGRPMFADGFGRGVEFLEFLLDHGAKLDLIFGENHYLSLAEHVEERAFLYRRHYYPASVAQNKVMIAMPSVNESPPFVWAESSSTSLQPPAFFTLMDQPLASVQSLIQIVRKSEGKPGWTSTPFDLEAWAKAGGDRDQLPVLQWGDIVEVAKAGAQHEAVMVRSGGSGPGAKMVMYQTPSFAPEVMAKLRAVQRIPFQVTVDGKTWDLTLHGGVTMYDPTTRLVPAYDDIGSPLGLADVLFMIGAGDPRNDPLAATVEQGLPGQRKTVSYQALNNPTFKPVLPGDRIEIKKALKPLLNKALRVTSPGLPLSVVMPYPACTKGAVTVVEAIALSLDQKNVVLPNPDWSKIVVQRYHDAEGVYKPETVDLAAVMGRFRTAEDLTTADAEACNTPLGDYDILELPMLQTTDKSPAWTGLDPAASKLFKKALARRVKYVADGGETRTVEVSWLPPRFEKSGDVWQRIPVPPDEGGEGRVTWPTVAALLDSMGYNVGSGGRDPGVYIVTGVDGKSASGGIRDLLMKDGDSMMASSRPSNLIKKGAASSGPGMAMPPGAVPAVVRPPQVVQPPARRRVVPPP